MKLEFGQNLSMDNKVWFSVVNKHFGRGCEKAHTPGTQASKNLPGPIGLMTMPFFILALYIKHAFYCFRYENYEIDQETTISLWIV